MTKLIPDGELHFHCWDDCQNVIDILLSEGYVVLLSREEALYVINYLWSHDDADRNDVVFMDRGEFEEKYYEDDKDDDWYTSYRIDRARTEAEERTWRLAKKIFKMSSSELGDAFGIIDDNSAPIWEFSLEEAKECVNDWERRRMEPIEDATIDAAMEYWDQMNREKYEDELKRSFEEV